MSLSLWDHQARLHDLEVAFEALRGVIHAEPGRAPALQNAARTLQARGEKGAAGLLIGDRASAPYRR
ncbi:MAG: hypothetical protein Q8M88_06130 [Phenylobacterium sp.]|uniref:hypothetical protein n=1 Tax=Phenylobacterium sp. TaxID=1871053 RepID=UPI002734B31B|nr:hypothetical protein [Phenylobacterium sp.]MDP3173994.1 hypothetical protein [Phenylobacterium sp.]